LYGAPRELKSLRGPISLHRNFLHAAALELRHPRTGEALSFAKGLPEELEEFLRKLDAG
jgi:23S rRNA-/tRNA-specific pseudouridylate synthase